MSRRQVAAERKDVLQVGPSLDPWRLVWAEPYIDGKSLARALEHDLAVRPQPDFRTRLLVRDAAQALRSFWGHRRFARWLADSTQGGQVRTILAEDLGKPGFPSIRRRLVENVDETKVRRIFDLLGCNVHDRVEVYVAGSISTLLRGLTARPTEDIDIVDEVPGSIRSQRTVLRKIKVDYGLTLGHVQSHYLPANWEKRCQWWGDFGGLRVFLVDAYDIFVRKLSSKQKNHQQDLEALALKLDMGKARRRLLRDGRSFLNDPPLKSRIEENWRFVFQEPLFRADAGAGGAPSG
jgi:hypothetical protein